MFLSSPRVDSIFSREKFCSPSAPRSAATQELSSVTVLSSNCHSLTRVSHLAIHSSETAFTFTYLSLRAATSSSASLWEVISAAVNQGLNPLIPVLYSAQNLTSSEKLSQV